MARLLKEDYGSPSQVRRYPLEHPVQITFRGLSPSDALKEAVVSRAARLERFYDKIESCRVVLEAPNRHHKKGSPFQVRVRLAVPGEDIVVSRDPENHPEHSDLHLAINDAFKEATRQLEDYVRRRRRQVKRRVGPPQGIVARLFEIDGYGFIQTEDGREIYFHENSVVDGFSRLAVGTEVRFAEEAGEKGPQASTVHIVSRQLTPEE